jgi:hypothetical protein
LCVLAERSFFHFFFVGQIFCQDFLKITLFFILNPLLELKNEFLINHSFFFFISKFQNEYFITNYQICSLILCKFFTLTRNIPHTQIPIGKWKMPIWDFNGLPLIDFSSPFSDGYLEMSKCQIELNDTKSQLPNSRKFPPN